MFSNSQSLLLRAKKQTRQVIKILTEGRQEDVKGQIRRETSLISEPLYFGK